MTEIVLFHHALGLTTGVVAFADVLRRAGHTVHSPDLYAGRTFDTVEAGVGHAQEIGFGNIIARGRQEAAALGARLVYGGFSLGVLPAQSLAQTRPGALVFHACVPASEFGPAWPDDVPVQIHAMENDPFFVGDGDIAAARAIVAGSKRAELLLYPGDRHLFADASTADHDPAASAAMLKHVLSFLARVQTE